MKHQNLTFLIICLVLISCKKDDGVNFTTSQYINRMDGDWQLVSYEINGVNQLSNNDSVYRFCSFYLPRNNTPDIQVRNQKKQNGNWWKLDLEYGSNDFSLSYYSADSSNIDSELNPFSYHLTNSKFDTFWRITYLQKWRMVVNNYDSQLRKEDIELVYEKI